MAVDSPAEAAGAARRTHSWVPYPIQGVRMCQVAVARIHHPWIWRRQVGLAPAASTR